MDNARLSKEEEIGLGKRPSEIQLFENLHNQEKGKGEWCDSRAEQVATKYQETIKEKHMSESDKANVDPPSDVPFDPQAWVKAIGVAKKNKVYGFGLTKEAENILCQTCSCSTKRSSTYTSTQVNNEVNVEAEVNARVEGRLEAFKLEMEQMKRMLESLQKTMPSNE